MKKILSAFACCLLSAAATESLAQGLPPSKVSFSDYEALVAKVGPHREKRLIDLHHFIDMSKAPDVVILDTRSDDMYRRKHIQGALHLNFSDFTQENLAALIPDVNTRILIYCNNNIDGDPIAFATKAMKPAPGKGKQKALTLALNIPTYINLFGYGYTNVYELSELVPVWDPRLALEGTDIQKHNEKITGIKQ